MPCHKCTENNFMEGRPLCAYCYKEKSCVHVKPGELILGTSPCDHSSQAKKVAAVKGEATLLQESADYSLGSAECDCRPDVYKSCAACTSMGHLGCTWVSAGKVKRTFEVGDDGASVTFTSWINGTCRDAGSSGTVTTDVTSDGGSLLFRIITESDIYDYFWCQCLLPNASFVTVVTIGMLMSCTLCAYALSRCETIGQKDPLLLPGRTNAAGYASFSQMEPSPPMASKKRSSTPPPVSPQQAQVDFANIGWTSNSEPGKKKGRT